MALLPSSSNLPTPLSRLREKPRRRSSRPSRQVEGRGLFGLAPRRVYRVSLVLLLTLLCQALFLAKVSCVREDPKANASARLCGTIPHLAMDGCYPLRCSAVPGLSSLLYPKVNKSDSLIHLMKIQSSKTLLIRHTTL